jgi:HEAT repeat protein
LSATDGALVELLRELTIAWKNRLAYPEGHPAYQDALRLAHRRIATWTESRGPLLLGIAADGWVVEDAKLDSIGLQKIAEALYQRGVAVLGFEPGLESLELAQFLTLLSLDPRRTGPEPIWDRMVAARVRHIYLEPVDYSRISLDDGLDRAAPHAPNDVWDRILRELVAGRELVEKGAELDASDRSGLDELSALLAEALQGEGETGPGDGTGAQAGGGEGEGASATGAAGGSGAGGGGARAAASSPGAEQGRAGGGGLARAGSAGERLARLMGRVFSQSPGAASIATVRRLAAVVRALPEALRHTLIDAVLRPLAASDAGAPALLTFVTALPRQTALASLERLAEERIELSARTAQLARELRAAQAGASPSPPPEESDRLFSELRELYGSADIDRLNPAIVPEVGRAMNLEMPRPRTLDAGQAPDLGDRRDTLAGDYLASQLAHAILEIVGRQRSGEIPRALLRRLRGAYRGFLSSCRLQLACEVVEGLRAFRADPATSDSARLELEQSIDRMADRRSIAALLDGLPDLGPGDVPQVHRLVEALGPVSVRHLLWALGEEDDRSRRHRLMTLLTALGPLIVGEATQLLADSRWFVVRNGIVLLRSVGHRPALGEIARCASHPDLRVRLEAIKTLFVLDSEVPPDLLRRAIFESDPKLAEAAVSLIGAYGIVQASEPLVELLSRRDFWGLRRGLRLKAIKALANLHDPAVLPRLRHLFRGGLFGVAREERLASYSALVCYPVESRRPFLERGRRSKDPELRAICARLEDAALASLEETRA